MSAVDEAREMIADYERVGETDACRRNRIALLAHIEAVEKERDDAWRQKIEAVEAWGASQTHIEAQDRAIVAVRALPKLWCDYGCMLASEGDATIDWHDPRCRAHQEAMEAVDAALNLAQPSDGKAETK